MTESTSSPFTIGIDLGTTNCALSFSHTAGDEPDTEAFAIPQLVHPGEISPRPLLPSFLYLPSTAEFDPQALALPWRASADIVGVFARDQGSLAPTRLVSSAKSWLSFAGADRRADILPWDAPDEVPRVSPVEASARYLAHLRAAWDSQRPEHPLDEQDVVLTVPASFDAVARELTVEAANQAGLEHLHLLEEPQAALYDWVARHQTSWRDVIHVGDTILVIDIGGGTTDFSLVAVREDDGTLQLERVAVGDHILLGGDNMDLALAYTVRARLEQDGKSIDDWQMRALTHGCRAAKEALLSDESLASHPLVIPGRSSKLIGGTIRAELSREELAHLLLEGFLPVIAADARPQAPKRVGLTTLGLPYASDPAITRHLAAFLGRDSLPRPQGHSFVHPTAILFNGGVTHSVVIRERIAAIVGQWTQSEGGRPPLILSGTDADLAVSRGAAYYAYARRRGGVRIRGGTAQAYYIGIERAELAVPGIPPRIDAVCIAPFGMEEGSDVVLDQAFGLVVGEPVSFRFFGSSQRRQDEVGTRVRPDELTELAPIETVFEGEQGKVVQVRLHASVTEVGTLEVRAFDQNSPLRWKLSFNVRG
jgi:molecular chaperone DnaK (HSP70)